MIDPSKIPQKYQWLLSLRRRQGLPRTISLALEEMGVKEVVGRGSNATIIGWRDELNGATQGKQIVTGYADDDIPWCGLFVAIVVFRRMKNIGEVVKNPLWARNWANYGKKSPQASLGDVLVFSRNGGGHVGFYIGEDRDCFHVIGGNQSNRVSIARIEKSRCIAIRRPSYVVTPASVRPFHLSAAGEVSRNEA